MLRWLPLCFLLLASPGWTDDGGFQDSYGVVQGPMGPAGPQGIQGVAGPQGIQGPAGGGTGYPPLVANFPGADFGQKLVACETSLHNVGTCDARTMTGSQTVSSTIDIYNTVLFGATTIHRAPGALIRLHSGFRTIGEGMWEGPGATVIVNATGDNSPDMQMVSGGTAGGEIANMYLQRSGAVKGDGSIGLDARWASHLNVHDSNLQGDKGVWVGRGSATCDCYNRWSNNVFIGLTYSFYGDDGSHSNIHDGNLYWSAGNGIGDTGLFLDAAGDTIIAPDIEGLGGTGIEIGPAFGLTVLLGGYFEANITDLLLDPGAVFDFAVFQTSGQVINNSGNNKNYVWSGNLSGPMSGQGTLGASGVCISGHLTEAGLITNTPC